MNVIIKKGLLLIVIMCFCACSEKRPLIGVWQEKHYTLWEKGIAYIKGVRAYGTGPVIKINADSSFEEIDCGGSEFGKWHVKGDSLILACDTIVWKDKQHSNLFAGKSTKYRHGYVTHRNKLVNYHQGAFSEIEKEPKDSSLKLGSQHKVYSLDIFKPVK